MLGAQISVSGERLGVLEQNRIKMVAMHAEIAEKLQHFDFIGLSLRNRLGQHSVILPFHQSGVGIGSQRQSGG